MADAVGTELLEWWEDLTTRGIGSRVVLVPAPSGWGRTRCWNRFTAAVLDAVPFSVVLRMDGRKAPPGSGPTAAWLAKLADDDRLVELARRALGLTAPRAPPCWPPVLLARRLHHSWEDLALSQELLHAMVRVLGPDHPDTLTTRSNIASWTRSPGQPPED